MGERRGEGAVHTSNNECNPTTQGTKQRTTDLVAGSLATMRPPSHGKMRLTSNSIRVNTQFDSICIALLELIEFKRDLAHVRGCVRACVCVHVLEGGGEGIRAEIVN